MTRREFAPLGRWFRLGPQKTAPDEQDRNDLPRFDRYLLRQFLVLFAFFTLVLVMIYWVNRAISLFDQLIASGQSAMVFVEFTALTLPGVIRLVLPVSAFAAVIYVTNRLMAESELVVVQATGYSPWRLARPALYFGLIVGLLMSILTHFAVPATRIALSEKRIEVAEDVTAQLLTEGRFMHPAPGLTFYIREITPEGELQDIFLNDARRPDQRTTYTAESALIAREVSGPKIVMFEGMAQTLNRETRQLTTTEFVNFTYDLGALIPLSRAERTDPRDLPTWEILSPSPELLEASWASRARMIYEANIRFSHALLAVAAPVLGFAILMLGGFSRFGMWRQIIAAVIVMLLIDTMDKSVARYAREDVVLFPLAYLAPAVTFLLASALLWFSALPQRRRGDGSGDQSSHEVPA